jgi:hypothetical protein
MAMPVEGPDGQILYAAHEAYNLIGRRLFGQEWTASFTGLQIIPDLALMRQWAAQGLELPREIEEFLEADPEEADFAQAIRRRESEAFGSLMHALEAGKAECWERKTVWSRVGPWQFCEDTESRAYYVRLIRSDVAAVLKDRKPAPRRVGIEKRGLDSWIWNIAPINGPSPLVPARPKPPHRPSAPWDKIKEEFQRRCEAGEIDPRQPHWELRISERLELWLQNEYPDLVQADAKTIRRRLDEDFHAYQHPYTRIKSEIKS